MTLLLKRGAVSKGVLNHKVHKVGTKFTKHKLLIFNYLCAQCLLCVPLWLSKKLTFDTAPSSIGLGSDMDQLAACN